MMKTYFLDNIHNIPDVPECVLTIGNFDGIHLGHQAMIRKTQQLAKQKQLATAVMVFEPQPREFFAKTINNTPARLTSLTEKQQCLNDEIDYLFVATFNEQFRSLSAKSFAYLLVTQLNVKALVLGDDFRFGHDRMGDANFLRQYGLDVYDLPTIDDASSQRISSTRIRQLLHHGQLEDAKLLLGRDYSITGKVLDGDKIGRTLDFPTANIALNRIKPALQGIFAVDVTMLNEDGSIVKNWHDVTQTNPDKINNDIKAKHTLTGISGLRPYSLFGAANIGTRPSVDGLHDWRLEVHFPQFSGNLYGKTLNVRFLSFLHPEKHYQSLADLKQGIHHDVEQLLKWRRQQICSA